MKTRLPTAALIALVLAGRAWGAAEGYRLDAQVYIYRASDFHTVTLPGAKGADPRQVVVIHPPATARFDRDTLELAGDTFAWSTGRNPPEKFSRISIPAMVLVPGQPLSLLSTAAVQFMERSAAGTLEVRNIAGDSPEAPHCRFTFTFGPLAADGALQLGCDLNIAAVSGREKIPGVELEVGKPVLARFAGQLDLVMRADEWNALVMPAPTGSDYNLLLLLKAAPAAGSATATTVAVRPMTAEELDRFVTWYYRQPQPELVGPAIAALDSSGLLKDRAEVFVGFFAEVFAANPDRVETWRKAGRQQGRTLSQVIDSAVELSSPGAVLAEKEQSVEQNDRCWGAFFASGNPAYLRKLAGRLPLIDDLDPSEFWVGATALWSLARNAAGHPLVRPTLEAFRTTAEPRARDLIADVLGKDPAAIRDWIRAQSRIFAKRGSMSINGLPSGGLRDFDFGPVSPNQELGHHP